MSNDFPESKEITKATLGELSNMYKQAQWNNSYKYDTIKRFFNISDIKSITSITRIISLYEHRITMAVFHDYLEKNKFIIEQTLHASESGPYPPEYTNIEISYKETKHVISEGMILILGPDNFRLAFTLEFYSSQEKEISVSVEQENKVKGEQFLTDLLDYAKQNNYLKNKKIMPDFSFLDPDNGYSWQSVILDEKTKLKITQNLNTVLNHLAIYNINKIPFKRGIVLKGVPGVGKTLIGKVLCNTSDITMIWVTPKYLESARQVAAIGDMARELSPSILFLEDIDLYGESRDNTSNKSLLGELMSQLDGVVENKNVIVIATTNRGDELEKALRNRPGRFDVTIEIPLPGPVEREKMLLLYTGKFFCETIDFKGVAEKCEKYTGAHVKDLVDLAVMTAVEGKSYDEDKKIILKQEHFEKNIKQVGDRKIAISDAFNTKRKERSFNPLESYGDD